MDKITDFLNFEFKPLQVNDTVADAENLFLDFNYSHFPILEQDIYIGSIAKDDTEILPTSNLINEHKFNLHRFFVRSNMNWFDVFEEFSKNHTNILPVLDEKNQHPSFIKKYSEKSPLKRLANPEEIAPAITFLLSNEASFITGHNLPVDGGWTAI